MSDNLIPDRILARELLRSAVQTAIFSPYGGDLLDVRRAVLIDGSDHGGTINVMTCAEYDKVLASLTASGTTLEGNTTDLRAVRLA